MSKHSELTIIVSNNEADAFKQTIIEAIKQIAIGSEGTQANNYPVIAELCKLYERFCS